MLIPPLVLIFLVLGTIFLGIATPTEGGALGAMGALIMAIARRKLSLDLLKQALENTTKLSCFVLFILIGSTVFSFTFNAAEGHIWVEHLFANMPGGAMGFLIVVNILVFILGMFIDFFEIAFIVIPMLAPVADKLLPALLPAGAAGRLGADLVRRHHRDEPADLVPDAAVRLCAVLPAQRGGAHRLQGPHHGRGDSGRHHRRRSTRARSPSSSSS